MPINDAKYDAIDPGATGPEAVARAFENQVAYCRDNGAPITALVCEALRELLETERGGTVMLRIRKWAGPALADALPLRIAGGLHALHLSGEEPKLAAIYEGLDPNDATELIATAIERHEPYLLRWLDGPPQTNEAGRSASFAAAFLWLVDRGLPSDFELLELGSSAGINLMMRRYRYDLDGITVGPANSRMVLKPEWRGKAPPGGSFDIVSAQGCDVAPVDLTNPNEALRLKAYIWPEFTERFHRMDAAIDAANRFPPDVDRMRADEFLADRLEQEQASDTTRVVMHSVVWQYIPTDQQKRISDLIEQAGNRASKEKPLAWVSLEANRDTHRHELTVRYWPGGEEQRTLATAHPHGAWIEWDG